MVAHEDVEDDEEEDRVRAVEATGLAVAAVDDRLPCGNSLCNRQRQWQKAM
jgi:hypothetical protein